MADTILVIDDDERLAEMLDDYLNSAGYLVTTVGTGSEGLLKFKENPYAAVVLDLMLPDADGLELCKRLRRHSDVPILMLTAKGDPMDRIVGLEIGADDYLPKPFEPRELLARIKAILRRGHSGREASIVRFGRLEIDRDALEARLDGARCDLTSYQFQLLDVLSKGAGRVLTRDFIMNQLQGNDLEAFDRSIDVHVSRIRAEIEDNPKQPKRVITVRGVGYVFAKAQA
ncbi:MAG: response regulator transcription factor [Pseudomonadota bacterium]